MRNPRITPKERGLLKGSIRRVFARSELRQKVLNSVNIEHHDPKRPRVKKWSRCPICDLPTPRYLMAVDHLDPVIPTNSSFEEMSLDTVVDRMWCVENNLQPICPLCHNKKTSLERVERNKHKKKKRSNK